MKEDSKPKIERLLNDESFRNWVKKSNQNDVTFWNTWIKNNPGDINDIYTAKDIILGIKFNKKPVDENKVNIELDHVLNRISQIENTKTNKSNSRFKIGFKQLAAIAAVGLILFSSINFFSQKEIVHKTGYGEIINLKLPDGTTVVLNGNSEIRYNKKEPRKVSLNGEGYFKVKSKPSTKSKFWVTTNDLTVEVYGTQFNVNTRDKKTHVVLDEGSINLLLKNGDSKRMFPGEFASFSNENNTVSHKKINETISYTSWREGTFSFNNTTLEDIMTHIKYTYGVSAEFIDEDLKQKTISGGLPNENIDICLLALQKASNIKIIKENGKLIIRNN